MTLTLSVSLVLGCGSTGYSASAQPMLLYQLVKVVEASGPDYTTWNSQAFADSNIQIKGPTNPTGPNLTLCQLFENGSVNEVWCMATQNQTKCGAELGRHLIPTCSRHASTTACTTVRTATT